MPPLRDVFPQRRPRDGRYELLMAIDHLLEGAQLYGKAAQDAALRADPVLAEYFGTLERTSRRQAETARQLLDQNTLDAAAVPAFLVAHDQLNPAR